jgi:hypothetical protein
MSMSSLRHRRVRFLLIVALVAVTPGCGGSSGAPAPDAGEIEALERQMWEDWKNRNWEAMRGRISGDAVILGAEGIMDRDGVVAAMAKQTCDVQDVALEDVKVTALAPTVALITYHASGTGTCDGQPIGAGSTSSIWVQRDGQWQTVHHQQSVSPTNAIAGNWELNLSKSKFVPAGDAPRSQARVYQVVGQQETGRHTGVNAQGNPSVIEFTAAYDGKDYPYKGSPDTDTVALTRVDANTTTFTQSREGKLVLTGTRVVSPDGKTLTITAKGTNAKGQPVDNVIVYDRR